MAEIPHNTTDQLDEQLTAYLDGELAPAEARKVEDMLAADEPARRRLNQLASSWDLLDQLPRASVDENFTRTTVEMVAVSTEEDIAKAMAAEPSKQRLRWLAASVIALLAAGVGFFAVIVLTPKHNDALLENLPVVANLEFYRPIGSVELLRDLQKANLFTSDPPPMSGFRGRPSGQPGSPGEKRPEVRTEPGPSLVVVGESLAARRAYIAKLSADQKLDLQRNLERFLALSPQAQTSLRELDHELNTAANVELANIARRYNDWLLRRNTAAERGMLEDLPNAEKVARIQQEQSRKDRFFFARIRAAGWMGRYAIKHEAELLAKLPQSIQDELEPWKPRRRGEGDRQGRGDGERQGWGGGNRYYELLAYEAWRHPKLELPPVREEEWNDLYNQLRDYKVLTEQLKEAPDANARMQLLRTWVQTGAFVRDTLRANFNQQVEEFKAKLSPEDRKTLAELPEEQKHEWLMQKWMVWRQSEGGGRFGQGFPPRGGREGFPPDDGRRKGPPPFDGEPPDRKGNQPFDGPRRGSQLRPDGPRGNGPRRDRNGPFGSPPPEAHPAKSFDPSRQPLNDEDTSSVPEK